MTAKVYTFDGMTKNDIDADFVLEAAKGKMDNVLVLGIDKEGNEYFAASSSDLGDALLIVELFKKRIVQMYEDNVYGDK